MMKRHLAIVTLVAPLFMITTASHAADVTMTWDGGSGEWKDAKWNTGLTPSTVIPGQAAGMGWKGQLDQPAGFDDPLVVIDGIGSDVTFDGDANGDFQWEDKRDAVQRGEIRVSGGATFTLQSDSGDPDGKWSEIDTGTVTVTGAGSVLRREERNLLFNGGVFAFGAWSNQPGEVIDLKVLDGGTVDNEGQMWLGAYGGTSGADSEIDLVVTWEVGEKATIKNDGALANGISNDNTAGEEGEINFIYNWDPTANGGLGDTDDSTYAIDMTGHGGQVIVGEEGIRVQEEVGFGVWSSTLATYQDLYAADRLLSDGSNAAAFGDKFFVDGSSGSADYTLRSIEGAVAGGSHPGDINGDCLINAIDAGIMFANFGGGPSTTVSQGNLNGSIDVDAADAGAMFTAWTGDPGPAPARTVIAASNSIPEPSTLALAAMVLCGVSATRRRRVA